MTIDADFVENNKQMPTDEAVLLHPGDITEILFRRMKFKKNLQKYHRYKIERENSADNSFTDRLTTG